ncbi:hypothetical protein Nepgr_031980 [Nepenthes gracilis]|uniref:Uncharacterized protein n=1 Tax=Nepenthes gracilis TaxID=150966 RepID=A0AAD3TJT4_NEPGR|nr:hypothetical protein Nepgr_031980 [Nepenthes gracilis]
MPRLVGGNSTFGDDLDKWQRKIASQTGQSSFVNSGLSTWKNTWTAVVDSCFCLKLDMHNGNVRNNLKLLHP